MLPLALALLLADAPKPKVPLGPDTTVVNGPLTSDGFIDYEAALNDRLSAGVTPDTNACVRLWQAIGPRPEGRPMHPDFYKRLGIAPPPADGPYFVPVETFVKGRGRKTDDALDRRLTTHLWTAKDQPDHADWLTANEKPLAVAVEASRQPGYFHPIVARTADGGRGHLVAASLAGVHVARTIADALLKRAMLRTADGRFAEAWADILAARRLGRLVARGGCLIELLAGLGIDDRVFVATQAYLSARQPTADQVGALTRELDALPPMPGLADKIDRTERFFFHDLAQAIRQDGWELLRDRENSWFGGPLAGVDVATLEAVDWEIFSRIANVQYDRARDAIAAPTRATRTAAWAKIEADRKASRTRAREKLDEFRGRRAGENARTSVSVAVGQILIGLFLPAAGNVSAVRDRHTQTERLTRLMLALAAHNADAGRYPENLAALVPKYLPAVER